MISRFSSIGLRSIKAPSFAARSLCQKVFLDTSIVSERVIEVVKAFDAVDSAKVTPTAHFREDLGLDSLDAVEVVMALEEEFSIEIPDDMAEKLVSTDLAIKFISEHPMSK